MQPTSPTTPITGKNLNSRNIMFVDDERELLKIAEEFFTEWGFRIETFADPLAAWQSFSRQPDSYNLVITDMMMPNLNGDRLAERLLSLRPGLPIILFTGFSEVIDREGSRRLGFQHYLQKPALMSELLTAVNQILEQQQNSSVPPTPIQLGTEKISQQPKQNSAKKQETEARKTQKTRSQKK